MGVLLCGLLQKHSSNYHFINKKQIVRPQTKTGSKLLKMKTFAHSVNELVDFLDGLKKNNSGLFRSMYLRLGKFSDVFLLSLHRL